MSSEAMVDSSFDSIGDSDQGDGSDTSEGSNYNLAAEASTPSSTPPLTPLASYHIEEVQNNTEKAITTFERFVSWEWPENCNDGAMEKLRLQLKHGGGFSSTMKTIDFSTPKNVRLDTDEVLGLLCEKTQHSRIESAEKLVLPVVTNLRSGEVVKNLLEDFCAALAGGSSTLLRINEIVLRCDEIPNDFCTGDLEWIENFHSDICKPVTQDKPCTTITVHFDLYPSNKEARKAFKKFRSKLCGKGRNQDMHAQSFFRKRNSVQNDTTSKRYRSEAPMEIDLPLSSPSTATKSEDSTSITKNILKPDNSASKNIIYYTLVDSWHTIELHESKINGRGVTIAFLDSGIDIVHQSLAGRIKAVNDITCSGDIDLTVDRDGHGTMSAFIACGKSFKPIESNKPVPAGVAPEASIVMYKIAESIGKAHHDIITKGLQMCLADKERYGIDIVVLPFGSRHHDPNQGNVIRELVNNGVLVVTASGNYGLMQDIPYPARLGCTICVGAHDKYGKTTSCTGEGDALDFLAPGENITVASSDYPTAFKTVQGTSCAAACVAGLLALIIQHAKSVAKTIVKQQVIVEELVHNQDVIKKVLREISKFPTRRKYSRGHGSLNPFTILSDSDNNKLLECLCKDIY